MSISKLSSGTPIPWTFKTWIANFKDVDLPIGDLARDILSNPDFPEEDDFGYIHEYLISKNFGSNVIETFSTVWCFYCASNHLSHLEKLREQYRK